MDERARASTHRHTGTLALALREGQWGKIVPKINKPLIVDNERSSSTRSTVSTLCVPTWHLEKDMEMQNGTWWKIQFMNIILWILQREIDAEKKRVSDEQQKIKLKSSLIRRESHILKWRIFLISAVSEWKMTTNSTPSKCISFTQLVDNSATQRTHNRIVSKDAFVVMNFFDGQSPELRACF